MVSTVVEFDLKVNVDHTASSFLPEVLRFILVEAVWAESVQLWSKYWPPRELFEKFDKEVRVARRWPIAGVSGPRSKSRSASPRKLNTDLEGAEKACHDSNLLSQSVGKNAPIFTGI